MNQEKIGKFIAECRKKQNLTQKELAEKLGLTYKAVSKWECGRGLPDVSLYEELCDILKISLNEFFAGEYIEEDDIREQSEKNILDILKFNRIKNNKYKLTAIVFAVLLIILLIFAGRAFLVNRGVITDSRLAYTQAYIAGESNVQGEIDVDYYSRISIDFDIGANRYGFAVFKDPKQAMKRLKKDYSKGIKLIQEEFNLLPLSNFTYDRYKTYGWQVTTGSEEEKEQAKFVTKFLDIYENSFN